MTEIKRWQWGCTDPFASIHDPITEWQCPDCKRHIHGKTNPEDMGYSFCPFCGKRRIPAESATNIGSHYTDTSESSPENILKQIWRAMQDNKVRMHEDEIRPSEGH